MRIDISEISGDFPDFRVAVIVARGLSIPATRPPELARIIAEHEADCHARWGGTELADIPGIAVWRGAYRAFGVKKTSYRCSVERLVKNVLAGRGLADINGFVDAYNAVSLAHVLPAGVDDLDRVAGDLAFRYSRPGDSFLDMAGGEEASEGPAFDPPKEGEVVYADEENVLCRRWNWRQDARSLVTTTTNSAVVTLQANGFGNLDRAVADFLTLVGAEVFRNRALNCWPWVRSLIHSPDAVIHSPAEIVAAWPTTVTRSRCPRAFTRKTQKPFSALWKVTRSTRPASTSWVDDFGCGFMRIARSSVSLLRVPIPWHLETSRPDVTALGAGAGLGGGVVHGMLPVRNRPAVFDHPWLRSPLLAKYIAMMRP